MTILTMKAIRVHQYGGPEELKLEEVARPKAAEGEVLVRVHSAGVLPIEWKIRQGYVKFPITFPYTPGTSFAGVVEEIGSGVTAFEKGQAVFGRSTKGTYAEFTTVPVQSLALLPSSVSFDEAAAITGGATTAWQAIIQEGAVKAGDRVLIHGAAGGVGLFAVQFAKWKGAYVIGTCGPDNVEFVRSLGADEVIDYTNAAFDEKVNELDIILDSIGGDILERSWPLVKQGGTLLSIVAQPSAEKANASGIKAVKPMALASSQDLEQIVQLMAEGTVRAVLSESFSLQEAGKAHMLSQKGHGRGRIVLHIAD